MILDADFKEVDHTLNADFGEVFKVGNNGNGKVDCSVVANALKGNAIGSVVTLNDVSPFEHVLKVRASSKNKITSISQYSNVNIVDGVVTQMYADTRANILYKLVTTTNGVVEAPATLTANGTGRHSMSFTVKEGLTQLVFGVGGTERDTTVKLNTIPKGTYTISWETTNATQGSISWRDMQIEEGTTATPWTPHIADVSTANVVANGDTIYPINAEGTVEGVNSIYPTTTLYTDTEGVVLDVEYNRDINKAFAELTNAILSLGGNV